MDNHVTRTLPILRTVIGYLGEKEQFGWWHSSFFVPHIRSFLAPVFVKTTPLAQYSGVTAAAALVHDERIGVGQAYHLFRLPEAMEQACFRKAHHTATMNEMIAQTSDKATALAYLDQLAGSLPEDAVGPTWVGNNAAVGQPAMWVGAASLYLKGFRNNVPVYPYFSDTPA